MRKKILISFAAVLPVALSGCYLLGTSKPIVDGDSSGNPASIYCEQNGGTLELVPDEGGSRGKCNFKDGSFCEEWAYYHGECSPDRGNGNNIGIYDIEKNSEISDEEKEDLVDLIEEAENAENEFSCTQDIKRCDDGTYVSRGGPNCEFSECPGYPLDSDVIQNLLNQYGTTGSELGEGDIELMNEIIDAMTQL